ncbi:MAG: CHAT domain-containing protein, partial [bacterium]|nr:CHAT domain-containing protein [bacterium]
MPERSNTPVIFLTFANDPVGQNAYLRNLPKERREISAILDGAEKAGLCKVVVRPNVTIDEIFDVFSDERYRDRIAIFHYAGHADSYRLLLETAEGHTANPAGRGPANPAGRGPANPAGRGPVNAHQEGLVPFLARQKGLTFAFLNGCATREQVLKLTRAGIPAAAGSYNDVDDEAAARLSIRFYKGIAERLSLEEAWKNAVDYVKTVKGKESSPCRRVNWQGRREEEGRYPWIIEYSKDNTDKTKRWTLTGDPLLGLPPIPKSIAYPRPPYRYLERYERAHARIFFGRSSEIRAIYDTVTKPASPPVMLLYGQSGVGKSSLLEAGLLPRLEGTHNVLYKRRSREKGLRVTFEE